MATLYLRKALHFYFELAPAMDWDCCEENPAPLFIMDKAGISKEFDLKQRHRVSAKVMLPFFDDLLKV